MGGHCMEARRGGHLGNPQTTRGFARAMYPADHWGKVKRMPDQSSAATEHAIIQEITAPLATLPEDPVSVAADRRLPGGAARLRPDGRRRLRQADQPARRRAAGDALSRGGRCKPRARARRRADLGDPAARARHRRADHGAVAQRGRGPARGGAPARPRGSRAAAEQRVKDLDADTDRIWAERQQIVEDTRELARQLLGAHRVRRRAVPGGRDLRGAGARRQARAGASRRSSTSPAARGSPDPLIPARRSPRTDEDGVHETGRGRRRTSRYDVEGDSDTAFQDADDSPTAVIDRAAIEDEAADKESTIVMPPRPADGSQDRTRA